MSSADLAKHNPLTAPIVAVENLLRQELNAFEDRAWTEGLAAHAEIELTALGKKSAVFYRHLLPLRQHLVGLLSDSYRKLFRLAVAHPSQTESEPGKWAIIQLQPAFSLALAIDREWYVLACEGENRCVRRVGSADFVPGGQVSFKIANDACPLPALTKPWRAPSWLFRVSPLLGFGPLKSTHVPNDDSEERLGPSLTRLLLKGGKRMFLSALGTALERAGNEEVAAAGAVRMTGVSSPERKTIKRKGRDQRLKLYKAIQTVLAANPALAGIEFCAELDKRHAPPLWDWTKSGAWRQGLTWKEAWRDPDIRRKIRRVRQEAQKQRST